MTKASTTAVRLSFIVLALCFLPAFFATFEAFAQEPRFFTKSQGARDAGLAQLRARLSQTESDLDAAESSITGLQANWTSLQNMSDTCADAFSNGANDDLILFWNSGGGVWDCGSEIDPTVQSWAKAALPSCGAGQVLSVTGNAFSCVDNAGASIEVDPHVRAFADTRQTLVTCGAGEVLTADGSDISCTANSGAGVESDPTVEGFAKVTLPTCGVGQVLRANGTSFSCVNDAGGSGSPISLAGLSDTTISGPSADQVLKWNGSAWVNAAESDPNVVAWAKTAITGGTAGACNANQVLTADDASALDCTDIDTLVGSNLGLGDLSDVTITSATANQVLAWNGSAWVNAAETDPGVETFAKTTLPSCDPDEVLSGSGGSLSCVSAATAVGSNLDLADLGDTNITAPVNGGALVWDSGSSRWIDAPATQSFAQATLPSCSGSEVLTGSGGSLSCTSAATAVGSNLNLSDLGDTSIASVGASEDGYALTWDNASGNWVASVPTAGDADTLDTLDSLQFVRSDASDSLVGDYDITGTLSATGDLTVDTTTLHVDAANNRVGIGTTSPAQNLHIATTGNAYNVIESNYADGIAGLVLDSTGNASRGRIIFQKAGVSEGGISYHHNAVGGDQYIGFDVAGGATDMVLDGAGYLGIGTTSPARKLEVRDTAAQMSIRSDDGQSSVLNLGDATDDNIGRIEYNNGDNSMSFRTNAADRVTILSSGNVGIGTVSPSDPLHVVGTGLFTGTVTAADPTAGAHLATKDYVDGAVSGSNAISQDDSAVTVTDLGTGVVTVDVDATRIVSHRVGGTTFDTGYIRATSGTAVAPMYSFINDTDTGPFLAADGTYAIATGGAERFRIDASGNVGIGTASPTNKLHIVDSDAATALFSTAETLRLTNSNGTNNTYASIGFNDGNIIAAGIAARFVDTTNNYADLHFSVRGAGGFNNAMIIDSDGNVGIGTTSPGANLHVEEAANLDVLFEGGAGSSDVATMTLSGGAAILNIKDSSDSDDMKLRFLNYLDDTRYELGLNTSPGQNVFRFFSPFGGDFAFTNPDSFVGIGTSATVPVAPLHVMSGTDVNSGSVNGYIVAGDVSSTNLRIDDNEIAAFNVNSANRLNLNVTGGDVIIGSSSSKIGIATGSIPLQAALEVGGDVSATSLSLTGNLAADTATFTGAVSGTAPTLNAHLATKQYVDEQVGGSNAIQQDDSAVTVTDTGTGVIKVNVDGDDIWSYRNAGSTVDQGPVWFQAGTAGAPGISINGDANTGIYSSGADALDISLGGTGEYLFSTSGVDVTNNKVFSYSAANNYLNWASGSAELAARDSITIRMDADNDDADSTINFQTNAGTDLMTLDQNGDLLLNGGQSINTGDIFNAAYAEDVMLLHANSVAETVTGGRLGLRIRAGFTDEKSVGVYGVAASNWGNAMDMALYTGSTAGGYSEKMRIDSAGNVGIGTTTPSTALDVSGTVSATEIKAIGSGITSIDNGNASVTVMTQAANKHARIDFKNTADGDNNWAIMRADDGDFAIQHSTGQDQGSGTVTEVLSVTQAGNVGIGTTAPTVALDVAGNISASMPTASSHVATKQYVDEQVGGADAVQQGDSSVAVTDSGTGVVKINVDGDDIFSFRNAGTTVDQGPVWFQAGTAGAPGVSFNGDPDTGVFNAAANTLSLSTSGTEHLRVDSTGNVGIGRTNPSYTLDVSGTTRLTASGVDHSYITALDASGRTDFNNYNSAADTTFRLLNSHASYVTDVLVEGGLSVGKLTAPSTALDVSGTVTATAFAGDGSGLTGISASSGRFSNGSAAAPSISFASDTDTGIFKTSDDAMNFAFGGTLTHTMRGDSSNSYLVARNNHLILRTERAEASDDDIIFQGHRDTGTSEWMRIKGGTGNVGIGTESPATALDVSGTVTVSDDVVADGALLGLHSSLGAVDETGLFAQSKNRLVLYTQDASSAPEKRLQFTGGASKSDIDFFHANTVEMRYGQNGDPQVLFDLSSSGAQVAINKSTASTALDVSGTVTATAFAGDGSNLTNISASSVGAAGSDTQIQFNNGGSFAGASNLYWDETNDRLGIGNASPASALDVSGTISLAETVTYNTGAPLNTDVTSDGAIEIGLIGNQTGLGLLGIQNVPTIKFTHSTSSAISEFVKAEATSEIRAIAGALEISADDIKIDEGSAFDVSTHYVDGSSNINNARMILGQSGPRIENVKNFSAGGSGAKYLHVDACGVTIGDHFNDGTETCDLEGDANHIPLFVGYQSTNGLDPGNVYNSALFGARKRATTTRDGGYIIMSHGTSTSVLSERFSVIQAYSGTDFTSPTVQTLALNSEGGNVGIGTTSPATEAKLDVDGPIKVAGTNSEGCDSDHYGMIRYNSVSGKMQMCRP